MKRIIVFISLIPKQDVEHLYFLVKVIEELLYFG